MNCDGCVFFKSTDYGTDDAGVEHAFGECHRYPPTPIQGSTDRSLRFAKFPRVVDDTWCGDFQSRSGKARPQTPHQRVADANTDFQGASPQDATDAKLGANNRGCQTGTSECHYGSIDVTQARNA
jgi:hypothetical protein